MGRGIYLGVEGSGTNMLETGGLIYRKLEKEFLALIYFSALDKKLA